MKNTKITITPAVREFNEQVENADWLLNYQYDQEPAIVLLARLQQAKAYPNSAFMLANAIAGIAVKKPIVNRPLCECGKPATWNGSLIGTRVFCCRECWYDLLASNPTLRDEQER